MSAAAANASQRSGKPGRRGAKRPTATSSRRSRGCGSRRGGDLGHVLCGAGGDGALAVVGAASAAPGEDAAVALQRQAVVRAGGDRDHAARGACGDGALAEHLGHTDLSTVARYGHADRDELVDATGRLEQLAAPREESEAPAAERPGAGDSLVAADACRASERLSAIQIRVPTCRNAEIGSFSIARSRNSHDAAEQRAALSASQASRSCSLAGAARGATTTVPSNTSGPRNAFISLSWERWRSICASMRTTAAYSAGSAGRSPGSRRSRIRSAAHQ